jgi:predicted small metal-binding protein
MAKVIYCSRINPNLKCDYVIRGETVEEVLQKAAAHVLEHGLKPGPVLLRRLEAAIQDEQSEN